VRLLFVKDFLAWPRSSGHDVHSFYMMQALTGLGHEVSLLTAAEPAPEAIAGLPLVLRRTFADSAGAAAPTSPPAPVPQNGGRGATVPPPLNFSRLQERFRSYWGIDPGRIHAVGQTAEECNADAVVVVGLNVLPYLGAVEGRLRVWYAADEWAWHHFSQVRLFNPSTWGELKQALVKGLYERGFRRLMDRVWVVTNRDRRAMQWVAGAREIDVIPNGVDGEHYRPVEALQAERTCTFWGRLDFGPNIQALEWFCQRVWPLVRRQFSDARFTINGFNPGAAVRAFAGRDGVELVPDLPDLRGEIARHQAVVLPFVSGGGIKNKLLEAASMGKAIVCAPHACGGLRLGDNPPMLLARGPVQWVAHLDLIWQHADARRELGAKARRWVLDHHSWQAAARAAAVGLEHSLREAGR
jgi:glycosyltransferase involved in cell wall biosynthesis